jgi:hypothetical protein
MAEDLVIMERLLEKTLEKELGIDPSERALGITLSRERERGSQPVYIEGYGAIFVLHVPFPVVGPRTDSSPAKTSPAVSAWEQTRRELYQAPEPIHPAPPMAGNLGTSGFGSWSVVGAVDAAAQRFESGKVERLKNALITALKNAANIRQMLPRETITLLVKAPPSIDPGRPVRVGPRDESHTQTHLSIQASQEAINDLASGKLTAEDFTRKAKVFSY